MDRQKAAFVIGNTRLKTKKLLRRIRPWLPSAHFWVGGGRGQIFRAE
jgi:hypothetical protein